MFRFEKLEVWNEAVELAIFVYEVTRNSPSEERFGLTSQLRRASVSISSNIAEGSSRTSKTDFARFIEIGYGSLMEVVSQSHVARRQELLPDEAFNKLYLHSERIARMLSGLRSSILSNSKS